MKKIEDPKQKGLTYEEEVSISTLQGMYSDIVLSSEQITIGSIRSYPS